jgi:AcrR family transcriptional regulator
MTRKTPAVPLRARARDAIREAIMDTALGLFDEQGFEATTVDDIASAAGISPRSFFRYFATKEDVVVGDPAPTGRALAGALTARPAAEPVRTSLHEAFQVLARDADRDPERALRVMRVISSCASLRARNAEKHFTWARDLIPLAAARLPGEASAAEARVVVLVSLACFDAALQTWVEMDGGKSLELLLAEAFATATKHA